MIGRLLQRPLWRRLRTQKTPWGCPLWRRRTSDPSSAPGSVGRTTRRRPPWRALSKHPSRGRRGGGGPHDSEEASLEEVEDSSDSKEWSGDSEGGNNKGNDKGDGEGGKGDGKGDGDDGKDSGIMLLA
jgi:hypothetical protein